MDEDYVYDYDDHYCDTSTYDAFDDIYADAQFEPYFDHDHHIDVQIEGVDDTAFREFDIYIANEDEDEEDDHQFGLGGYEEVRTVFEDIHVNWGNQDDDELVDDEDESLSLSRLLRDGITAVVEQLERAVVEQCQLPSLNWKSWSLFGGRQSQINVSLNPTVPSTSAANSGDREEEVEGGGLDKAKDPVRTEIGPVSCPICLEHWTTDGEHYVCSLPCGHLYGMSCIKRWLQQQNPGKCPQCKKMCKLEDVRKLYGSFVAGDKHLEEKIRCLEAKCALLELKDSEWEKKEAEWRQKEADLSRQLVKKVKKEKVDDLLAEVHA